MFVSRRLSRRTAGLRRTCGVRVRWPCRIAASGLAASQRGVSLAPPVVGSRRTGSIVLADDNAVLAGPALRDTKAATRKAESRAGPRGYPIPEVYLELFRTKILEQSVSAAGSEEGDEDGEEREDSERSAPDKDKEESVRDFWREVRRSARERMRSSMHDVGEPPGHEQLLHESLWIEELGQTLELRQMHLTKDSLTSVGEGLFSLDVAELGSGASCVEESGLLRGVAMFVKSDDGEVHRAMVQPSVRAGKLLFSAPANLSSRPGPFQVEFRPLRFQQTAMHRALDSPSSASLREWVLGVGEGAEAAAKPVSPVDTKLSQALPASLNESQRRVAAAVIGRAAREPLVVWGPPGTGKSTLAAFIVWHLVQEHPTNLHILLAAPSNTAADVLCEKLAKLGVDKTKMLRLNALGRSVETVPEAVQDYCFYAPPIPDMRPSFAVPPLSELRSYRVVVTTCICSAHISNALHADGTQNRWFSHVIIDEAGEATEPESRVPLALLRRVAGQVVFLGDHFQLGPLVVTPLASQLGKLDRSMMQRLVSERFEDARTRQEREGEAKDALTECEGNGLFFLTQSFRSHPAIMALYSTIFYSAQLEHCPRPRQFALAEFCKVHDLSSPVVMHHVVGAEKHDAASTSLYNLQEVDVVLSYLSDLLQTGDYGLTGEDVGVISPYAKQVQVLQQKFERLGSPFAGITCGTVENFQGQERSVVIISAVRSSGGGQDVATGKSRRPIGFLADPRRLNVAVSRAVAGLIIVGDLQMLAAHSAHWRQLVEMGRGTDSLRGNPLVASPTPVRTKEAEAAWSALTSA